MTTKELANPGIFETKLHIFNKLKKKVHVIISPNPDYELAELYAGLASLVSGIYSLPATANNLLLFFRSISFLKNFDSVLKRLRNEVPKLTVTIDGGKMVEVFDAMKNDPLIWTKISGIITLFGGKGFSLLIVDEDFEKVVMFNTSLGEQYTVDETGVTEPMHFWNASIPANLDAGSPPTLVRLDEKMLLLYRFKENDKVFATEFVEGIFKHLGHFDRSSSTGFAAVATGQGRLSVFGRHASDGEQMYCIWSGNSGVPLKGGNFTWMDISIQRNPSAAILGSTICIVAKHRMPGDAVLWVTNRFGGKPAWGNTMCDTVFPPAIQAFMGKFFMVYTVIGHQGYKMMKLATSADGKDWKKEKDLTYTSAGAALTVYKNRLYIIYRDPKGDGVFYMWTENGTDFFEPPSVKKYFGFDVVSEPTAAPVPGENNGIMIAGIQTAQRTLLDPFPTDVAVSWTILVPYEKGRKRKVTPMTAF